jgi:hypothetical protein
VTAPELDQHERAEDHPGEEREHIAGALGRAEELVAVGVAEAEDQAGGEQPEPRRPER